MKLRTKGPAGLAAAAAVALAIAGNTAFAGSAGGGPSRGSVSPAADSLLSQGKSVRGVDVMFGLAGASGLYETGATPRAFRDAHAVKQHFSFNTDIAATTYGRVALGLPTDNPTL